MAQIDQDRPAATAADGQLDPGERLVRAFNELRDELISTLLFVLGNREDAHDAAQEEHDEENASRCEPFLHCALFSNFALRSARATMRRTRESRN